MQLLHSLVDSLINFYNILFFLKQDCLNVYTYKLVEPYLDEEDELDKKPTQKNNNQDKQSLTKPAFQEGWKERLSETFIVQQKLKCSA
jgi:hypothetical protein